MQRIERALLTLTACGGLLALLAAAGISGRPALADTVKARRASHVYSSPGEQSRVVARVRPGDKIHVLQRKNRWFKVRVKGRTGWIARKSVGRQRVAARGQRGQRGGRRRGDRIAVRSTSDVARELAARDPSVRAELKQRAIVRQRILRRELELARAEELALVQAEQREAARRAGRSPAPGPAPAREERLVDTGVGVEPAAGVGAAAGRLPDRRPLQPAEAEALAIDGVAGEAAARPVTARPAALPDEEAMDDMDAASDGLGAPDGGEIADGVVVRESEQLARRARAGESEQLVRRASVREMDPVERDDQENPLAPPAAGGAAADRPAAATSPAGGHKVVVVAERARLYQLPSPRSEAVERAAPGSELVVLVRRGAWIKVQNQRGVAGWIPRVQVVAPRPRPPVEKLVKRATAGIGYAAIGQRFSSSSDDPRGAYSLSSGAAVVGAGGELVYASSASWRLAGDLGYRFTVATPGIRYTDPESGTSADIGFQRHQIDLGARAGYVLGGDMGMVAYGRVGFHYDNFRIADVSNFDRNLARLPSEVLTGVTVGASLDVPHLADAWSARVRLDALPLLASRQQTTGLEDGASTQAFAAWGGARVEYAWGDVYKVSGEYQYAYARTRWTGVVETSMRPHMADSARRKDGSHLLFVGVGRSF